MLHEFTPIHLTILGTLIFFSGIVDALAGGGGLISLPAYLAAGLNPALLLGTNKLSSSMGTTISAVRYGRNARFNLASFAPVIFISLIGSWLGAQAGQWLSPQILRYLLLVAIPVIGYAVFSRHNFGHTDSSSSLAPDKRRARSMTIAFPLGLYDGFFGPGTGTFLTLAFTHFCRYDLLKATTCTKILNLTSNLTAMITYLLAGRTHAALGLSMGGLSVAGNYVGSHWGIKRGATVIRPMILLVCSGLFAKLLWDTVFRP
jgi:uncharacterized protein